jgi:hypothetical protein
METKNMTTKKVLLALAATGLLAFGSVAPVLAEDPPPADDGTMMDVPADPDSAEVGDMAPDAGTEEGAGDAGMEPGTDPGMEGGEPAPQPE